MRSYTHVAEDTPLTRGELAAELKLLRGELAAESKQLRAEIAAESKQLRDEIAAESKQLRDDLLESIRSVETNLLKAFHGWARPNEIRMRALSSSVQGFDERLALLEERVADIERRRSNGA
ncbi:MAG: hypothetical protein KIT09_15325 [Bryobacteraceae bacterium]|nr:hypothetical protein [Bryobacteraceae bacterium]